MDKTHKIMAVCKDRVSDFSASSIDNKKKPLKNHNIMHSTPVCLHVDVP